jgi:SAM-dependent methyltransferase
MRPHADAVDVLRRELRTDAADMLLLGVTPEYAKLGKTMVAVDAGAHMIGALWIGDSETRKALLGNWLDLPLPDRSVDAVVGDGCLSAVVNKEQRLKVLEETARVLRPGGRAGMRLFVRQDAPESFDAIKADVEAGNVTQLTELVLRIAVALPAGPPDYGRKMNDVLDVINGMYPERADLLAVTGWKPEAFGFIDLYKGSETVCTWPSTEATVEEARRHFGDVRVVPSGNYRFAELCPIMLLAEPLG